MINMFLREGSGLGVLGELLSRRPDQVAIVLTNCPTVEIRRRCAELRCDGLYDKSLELDSFLARCLTLSANR
ncbi:MAG: hypothetical protein ABW210_12615 [Achromobacter sp.]